MQDGFPANYLDPSNLVIRNLKLRAATQDAPRTMVQQFGAGIERELARNMVVSADAVGSFTKHLAVLRNLNQPLRGTLDANGALPYPNFGNIQAREMNGEANYKGVDLSFEKRFERRLRLPRVVHHRRSARPGARAPQRLIGPRAEHARPRIVGGAERLRRPSSLRRQLHRRAAVRRGQADAAGRRGRQDPRRLAGERHLQRALGPRLHRDAGQQQRRRRSDRHAQPHRRSRRAPRRCSSGSIPRRSRRCRRARSAMPAATSCAGRAGSRST